MYNSTQPMIDNWKRQRDKIDELIQSYQNMPTTQNPINNFISTSIPSQDNLYEMKKLNEKDEVENIAVFKDTVFIGDDRLQIKKTDGTIEKYEIKKVYPKDKKDEKIDELTKRIKELEERLSEPNEHRTVDKPTKGSKSTDTDVDAVI